MYIDTNILLRVITGDVPELTKRAYGVIHAQEAGSIIVLEAAVVEICFVLEFHEPYKMTHRQIADRLLAVIGTEQFKYDDTLVETLRIFAKHPKLDFVDCLLAVKAKGRKKNVLTFDTELQKVLK